MRSDRISPAAMRSPRCWRFAPAVPGGASCSRRRQLFPAAPAVPGGASCSRPRQPFPAAPAADPVAERNALRTTALQDRTARPRAGRISVRQGALGPLQLHNILVSAESTNIRRKGRRHARPGRHRTTRGERDPEGRNSSALDAELLHVGDLDRHLGPARPGRQRFLVDRVLITRDLEGADDRSALVTLHLVGDLPGVVG